METLDEIVAILRKYLADGLTDVEHDRLKEWSTQHPEYRNLLEELSDEESLFAGYTDYVQIFDEAASLRLQQIENRLMASVSTAKKEQKRRYLRWLPYAAAVFLVVGTLTWILFHDSIVDRNAIDSQTLSGIIHAQDVAPGGNRATLQLSDGRTIDLSEAQTGIIVKDGNLTYADHTSVVELGDFSLYAKPELLALTTPRGGVYHVTLPDQSKVWLNAATTLKYPSIFMGDERVVELEGEGYFEVTPNRDKPFKVISKGQVVEVLGTAFNISAYAEESSIKTTLVEGKVRVASSADFGAQYTTLQPGNQSVVRGATTTLQKVDVQQYVAWRDGFFYFDGLAPKIAFDQLERWYDILVLYEGKIPSVQFFGMIDRSKPLISVLKTLEKSGLKFEFEQSGGKNQLIILDE